MAIGWQHRGNGAFSYRSAFWFSKNKIRSRFEQSRAAILPLESQIVVTDELIDQIVYRLYGLSPDEIKIVEDARKA